MTFSKSFFSGTNPCTYHCVGMCQAQTMCLLSQSTTVVNITSEKGSEGRDRDGNQLSKKERKRLSSALSRGITQDISFHLSKIEMLGKIELFAGRSKVDNNTLGVCKMFCGLSHAVSSHKAALYLRLLSTSRAVRVSSCNSYI